VKMLSVVRVRAASLVVLWREFAGVEGKRMVAHTC